MRKNLVDGVRVLFNIDLCGFRQIFALCESLKKLLRSHVHSDNKLLIVKDDFHWQQFNAKLLSFGVVDFDIAENHVVIFRRAFRRHLLSDDIRHARRQFFVNLFLAEAQAMPVISPCPVDVGQVFQPFFGAKAIVSSAQFHQLFGVFHINTLAFGLNIRSASAVFIRTFVMLYPRLFQSAVYGLHRSFHISFAVRVLYAQNELAALLAREQVCVKTSAQIAYMHKARG